MRYFCIYIPTRADKKIYIYGKSGSNANSVSIASADGDIDVWSGDIQFDQDEEPDETCPEWEVCDGIDEGVWEALCPEWEICEIEDLWTEEEAGVSIANTYSKSFKVMWLEPWETSFTLKTVDGQSKTIRVTVRKKVVNLPLWHNRWWYYKTRYGSPTNARAKLYSSYVKSDDPDYVKPRSTSRYKYIKAMHNGRTDVKLYLWGYIRSHIVLDVIAWSWIQDMKTSKERIEIKVGDVGEFAITGGKWTYKVTRDNLNVAYANGTDRSRTSIASAWDEDNDDSIAIEEDFQITQEELDELDAYLTEQEVLIASGDTLDTSDIEEIVVWSGANLYEEDVSIASAGTDISQKIRVVGMYPGETKMTIRDESGQEKVVTVTVVVKDRTIRLRAPDAWSRTPNKTKLSFPHMPVWYAWDHLISAWINNWSIGILWWESPRYDQYASTHYVQDGYYTYHIYNRNEWERWVNYKVKLYIDYIWGRNKAEYQADYQAVMDSIAQAKANRAREEGVEFVEQEDDSRNTNDTQDSDVKKVTLSPVESHLIELSIDVWDTVVWDYDSSKILINEIPEWKKYVDKTWLDIASDGDDWSITFGVQGMELVDDINIASTNVSKDFVLNLMDSQNQIVSYRVVDDAGNIKGKKHTIQVYKANKAFDVYMNNWLQEIYYDPAVLPISNVYIQTYTDNKTVKCKDTNRVVSSIVDCSLRLLPDTTVTYPDYHRKMHWKNIWSAQVHIEIWGQRVPSYTYPNVVYTNEVVFDVNIIKKQTTIGPIDLPFDETWSSSINKELFTAKAYKLNWNTDVNQTSIKQMLPYSLHNKVYFTGYTRWTKTMCIVWYNQSVVNCKQYTGVPDALSKGLNTNNDIASYYAWITDSIADGSDLFIVYEKQVPDYEALSILVSLMPIVGEWYDILILALGEDPITKQELTQLDKILTQIWLLSGAWSGAGARKAVKETLAKLSSDLWIAMDELIRIVNKVVWEEYSYAYIGDIPAEKLQPSYIWGRVREKAAKSWVQDKILTWSKTKLDQLAKTNWYNDFHDLKRAYWAKDSKWDAFTSNKWEIYFKRKPLQWENFEPIFTDIFIK